MKYYKENSDIGEKMAKIEDLMYELDLSVSVTWDGGLCVNYCGSSYKLYDVESDCNVIEFPRRLESEKIIID